MGRFGNDAHHANDAWLLTVRADIPYDSDRDFISLDELFDQDRLAIYPGEFSIDVERLLFIVGKASAPNPLARTLLKAGLRIIGPGR